MIWKQDIECMDPAGLKALQSTYLKKLIPYIYQNCPVYKQKLDAAGVKPDSIQSIDDIKRLPFTTKEDMRDNYPYGLFCAKQDGINEIHISSGTTGNPTFVGYTKDDLALWSDVMARQLKIMQDFKPRIIACTPSYALYMAEQAKEMGIHPTKGNWKIGIFGAEPWSESMRQEIEAAWNMLATDVYGLSEIIEPGVAQECRHKAGLHIFSDVFYPEIINPETGEVLKDGQEGELVLTNLVRRATPMLRYRTRDLAFLYPEGCDCGRTHRRLSRILGRTDDMLIINGINVLDAYGFVLQPHKTGICCMEIDTPQMARAEQVIQAAGFAILQDEELYGM